MPTAKPVEQKRRLGNPGQRKLPELAAVRSLPMADPEPLVPLGDAGRALWEQVKATCGAWVALSDTSALLELCKLADRRDEMWRKVCEEGLTLRLNNSGAQAHPLLSHIETVDKSIHKLMGDFGMTPKERGLIGVGEVKAVSKLQQILESEGRK